ncbi:type II toxin-antitoxin system prevent-host-death family antitoxin [Streptococcus dysgalactiae subsp. dysgalactiae]|nr:type II toxin-antitoxin system prevent-host-death family antitoxin [Streptococcus dysgalactiae subsp. dysgalactiae]
MEAVVYSNFRNNLKDYMKKVNDEFEPLIVVNKNPDENIVVLSQDSWESLQETIRVMENDYLSQKVIDGISTVKKKQIVRHDLIEVEDV